MKKQLKKLPNYYITDNGVIYNENDEVVETFKNPIGYISAVLNDRIVTVAYLVANTFIPNNDKCILVGYKDHDYNNINVDNLYWYYTGEYEERTDLTKEYREKKKEDVEDKNDCYFAIDKDNNILETYSSQVEIKEKTGKWKSYHIREKTFDSELNCFFVSANDYNSSDNIAKELIELNYQRNYKDIILKIDYQGNIIKEYPSMKVCAKDNKMSYAMIRKIIAGDAKQRSNYYLIYKKDYSINTIQFRLNNELKKQQEEEYTREQKKEEERRIRQEQKEANKQRQKEQREAEIQRQKEQREAERRIRQEQKEATRKKGRPIQQYTLDNVLVKTYNSIREIEEETGFKRTNIYNNLCGDSQMAYNYKWCYLGEQPRQIHDKRKDKRENKSPLKFILQYDLEGNLIKEYNTIKDAVKETGFARSTILYNLTGKTKITGKKYIFKLK